MRPLRDTSVAGTEQARVLVVEPDERACSVIESALLREGFQVAAFSSAEDAQLQLAPGRPLPSVVVCEADLRGADGFSLCKQIRDEERTSILPVILLSRRPEKYYPRLAGGVGADDYVAKPAFANDVVALVQLRAGTSSFDALLRSSTQVVSLPKLLRALLAGVRSGRVDLERGGQITFRQGRIVDAVYEPHQGVDALMRLLLLAEGDYSVEFSSGPTHVSFSFDLEVFCTKVFPQIARWEQTVASGPPLDSRLVVRFAQLGAVLSGLPPAVKELVRLCDGRRTVRDCLLESSLSESQGFAAIARLHSMGVLTNPPTLPAHAPARAQSRASGVGTDGWNVISLRRNEPLDPSKSEPIGSSPGEPDLPVVKPIPLVHVIENSSDSMGFTGGDEREAPSDVPASNFAPPAKRATTIEAVDRSPEHSTPAGEDIASAVFAALDPADPTRDTSSASSSASAVERAFFQEETEAESPLEKLWEHRSARVLAMMVGVLIVAGGVAWVGKLKNTRLNTAVSLASASVPAVPKPAPAQPLAMEPLSVSVQTPVETLEDGLELYNEGKAAEAAQVLARVVETQPSPTSWLMLGVARFDSGDNRGAEEAAVKSLEMEPKNGRAMILRATIYLAAHQRQKAAEELRRYLKTDPEGPYAEEAKQLLSSW